MKRLAPGVYDDGKGGLHLDTKELLEASGYAVTAENERMILEAAREQFGNLIVHEDGPLSDEVKRQK